MTLNNNRWWSEWLRCVVCAPCSALPCSIQIAERTICDDVNEAKWCNTSVFVLLFFSQTRDIYINISFDFNTKAIQGEQTKPFICTKAMKKKYNKTCDFQ